MKIPRGGGKKQERVEVFASMSLVFSGGSKHRGKSRAKGDHRKDWKEKDQWTGRKKKGVKRKLKSRQRQRGGWKRAARKANKR